MNRESIVNERGVNTQEKPGGTGAAQEARTRTSGRAATQEEGWYRCGDADGQPKKITDYFPTNALKERQPSLPRSEGEATRESNRRAEFERRKQELDEEHEVMMRQIAAEKQKQSQYLLEQRENKRKTRKLMAEWTLELANADRKERHTQDLNMGEFVEKNFIEGPALKDIRNQIGSKQDMIRELTAANKKRNIHKDEHFTNWPMLTGKSAIPKT